MLGTATVAAVAVALGCLEVVIGSGVGYCTGMLEGLAVASGMQAVGALIASVAGENTELEVDFGYTLLGTESAAVVDMVIVTGEAVEAEEGQNSDSSTAYLTDFHSPENTTWEVEVVEDQPATSRVGGSRTRGRTFLICLRYSADQRSDDRKEVEV